jgi:hypothetical protein
MASGISVQDAMASLAAVRASRWVRGMPPVSGNSWTSPTGSRLSGDTGKRLKGLILLPPFLMTSLALDTPHPAEVTRPTPVM